MKPENSELTYPSVRAAGANDHILGGFKKKTERCSPSSEARLLTGRCQQASWSEGSGGGEEGTLSWPHPASGSSQHVTCGPAQFISAFILTLLSPLCSVSIFSLLLIRTKDTCHRI